VTGTTVEQADRAITTISTSAMTIRVDTRP
jgi:hypothetical protein